MTQLFQNRVQKTTNGYAHDTIVRYLNNLEKVGAITKVCNAYTDLDNHYLYSSRFICSKEKLRELVSLFISTFYTSTTHISLSSSTSSYTHTLSLFISYPLLGTMKGGKKEKCVKMIQQNDGFYLQKGAISENELNNILKDTVHEYLERQEESI